MKLHELAHSGVITIGPSKTLDLAMALMEEHGIRHLPVLEEGRPVGMVSDRDLLASVGGMSSDTRVSCSEGPSLISCAVMHKLGHLALYCARGALSIRYIALTILKSN